MNHLILLISLSLLLACSKSDNMTPANALAGTWRLANYCKPASTSGCTAITVPDDKGVFVFFGNEGNFNEYYENTKPIEYGFLGCGGGTYEIEGDKLRIMAVCMSSSNGKLMKVVSVNTNRLVLNPNNTGEYIFVR